MESYIFVHAHTETPKILRTIS